MKTFTKTTTAALLSTALVSTALLGSGGVAAASPAVSTAMTSTSLLQLEGLRSAGLTVDSAQLDATGNVLLGDAGRFDEGCLGEKTMRNITSAKAYPAPGEARAYFDGTWTSTLDKDVWLREAIAEGRSGRDTDRYVRVLRSEIASVRSCQQDPAQGHSYGPARVVRSGSATATLFLDYGSDGRSHGGGVAIIRDGNRFGLVDLLGGDGKPAGTLRRVAVAAAGALR